jgi:nucleoside-diphosphate-sugar epimerase
LVTGVAGFIGSAVARKLLAEGNEVITIDNLSTGYDENVPHGSIFIRGNDYEKEGNNMTYCYKSYNIELGLYKIRRRKYDGRIYAETAFKR